MPRNKVKQGAIFLDRDGVINVPPARKRYVTQWNEFRFLPGVLSGLRKLRGTGRRVVVVSNQAGVGRGIFPRTRLQEITRNMRRAVETDGGRIHAVYYCIHTPQRRCRCRKPRTGLLLQAARRFSLDLKRSFVVGDNATDIEMGRTAGCGTVLVLSGMTGREEASRIQPAPDFIARNLADAVRWILRKR